MTAADSFVLNCLWKTQSSSWKGSSQITFYGAEKETPAAPHHGHPDALIFAASRWQFGFSENWGSRPTSHPAPFTVFIPDGCNLSLFYGWKADLVIQERLRTYLNSVQARLRRPGGYSSWILATVYEGTHCQWSMGFPQEARRRFLDKLWALSQICCRVKQSD